MVHNTYIHIGVLWTSADPPPRRLSWPTLGPLDFIGLEPPLQSGWDASTTTANRMIQSIGPPRYLECPYTRKAPEN